MRATANDADGTVSVVQFFAGTNELGTRFSRPFQWVWNNVPVGRHVLTATAIDNRGATVSSTPLQILVRLPPTNSFIQRQLPVGYWPGDLVRVSLLASPPTFIHGYSVEDRPPTGWVVGLANQGGAFDTNTGVVRFGPFGDSMRRTLTYEVMVPLNETGDKMFVGTGSADGWSSFIVGDHTISAPPVHPADRNPADFLITLGEVTNYLAAWQLGSDQNPVPIGYLTRAAMLWQAGQAYRFDPMIPNPPLWWLSLLASNALPGGGTAASQMPSTIQRRTPFAASVAVTPAGGVRAYAVEDHIPSGWAVTNISHGGIVDARNGKIKWGPFLDASARTLSCQFIPSEQVAGAIVLSGVASFDGIDVPITGQRWTLALYAPTLPVGGYGIIRSKSGECRAMFTGEAGHRYVVAVSEDLANWIPLVTVPAGTNGAVQCVDLKARDAPWRFYRIFPE